jgi:hypothetical protein
MSNMCGSISVRFRFPNLNITLVVQVYVKDNDNDGMVGEEAARILIRKYRNLQLVQFYIRGL